MREAREEDGKKNMLGVGGEKEGGREVGRGEEEGRRMCYGGRRERKKNE